MEEGDIRTEVARPRFEPENYNKNTKLLVPYARIAEEQGCTMAQLALAWLLAQDDLVPIPGTKRIDHMIENAGAGDISLPGSVVQQLDELINEDTVYGRRYDDGMMNRIDSEKD